MGKTQSAFLAIELSTTFTIEHVFTLFFLHNSNAAEVSAVSPDWETNKYKVSLLNFTFLYLNSEAISVSTDNEVNSSNQYLATKHE